ncbi:FAD-dependent oxidoreductase [Niabella ginsengisoli]|uniref:FAD-dependent oxidoreductase n=2 Tax=Niabella ginsengisoli TaxID=522298 RepID=A0ABS9SL33_9BACT|nr:FAD-dependent oxidoreductase [Niabella ginsengisoli]
MLSWFLAANDIDFTVIDNGNINTPSQAAAGLINPVTGRRVVTVWLDDVIIPFAEKVYNEMGSFLNINALSKTTIIDFFPNPFMRESFLKKLSQQALYINLVEDANYMSSYFNYEFGTGTIDPAYIVHLQKLLPAWRNHLLSTNQLISDPFDFSSLVVKENKIVYKDINADQIIFCDGVQGNNNPYFSLLPFALNKGEALIIEAPDLPPDYIYKKSMTIAPFAEPGTFWTGTNYIWDFEDDLPTPTFRSTTEQTLKSWLKVPFKVIDHKAAVRPATIERRPFVGFHPLYKNVGILNGMGTKGCSLAPYFAHQLVENILHKTPIEKDADIERHSRILARTAF